MNKVYLQIKTKEELLSEGCYIDVDLDFWESEEQFNNWNRLTEPTEQEKKESWILEEDIGGLIEKTYGMFAGSENYNWAIKREVTKEKNPEYFL